MRNLYLLDAYRDCSRAVLKHFGGPGDDTCGMFNVPSKIDGQTIKVVASSGMDWDHVSVSRSNRCPNWPEMEQIKHLFFKDDETCMQLHVPPSDHINFHPYCLHIWRPQKAAIPRPPAFMVGSAREAAE